MTDLELVELAIEARELSYSPYSHFAVGAVVLCKDGTVYKGANVENATYGATICAERNAINKAILAGEKEFEAIAIMSSSNDYTFPCGICRQALSEFVDVDNFYVILPKTDTNRKILDFKVLTLSVIVVTS